MFDTVKSIIATGLFEDTPIPGTRVRCEFRADARGDIPGNFRGVGVVRSVTPGACGEPGLVECIIQTDEKVPDEVRRWTLVSWRKF